LYKEKDIAIGMGNMKKAYWLTMNNVIERNLLMIIFLHGSKPSQGEVRCVNNIIKKRASLAPLPKL
jgi:hypothetical protein